MYTVIVQFRDQGVSIRTSEFDWHSDAMYEFNEFVDRPNVAYIMILDKEGIVTFKSNH